jgi:hypothetical protein
MHHRHQQGQAADDVGDAERDLQTQQGEYTRPNLAPGGAPVAQGRQRQRDYDTGSYDRPETMDKMDSRAGGLIENPELLIHAQPAPQHKSIVKVHVGPKTALTGGKICAGKRRIICAGPAPEENLQRQHDYRENGEQP